MVQILWKVTDFLLKDEKEEIKMEKYMYKII